MSELLKVGITHGDINGISYEVIIKALANEHILELMTPVVFGSEKVLNFYRKVLGMDDFRVHVINDPAQARDGQINWVNITDTELKVEMGRPTQLAGHAALLSIDRACRALEKGLIDVLVTAPINKHTIHGDEFQFAGHTEYLENRFAETHDGVADKALMVLFAAGLRVALLTSHIPVSEVTEHISIDAIKDAVKRFDAVLRKDFRIEKPKIAVLSLNPHCGDHGLIGNEDDDIVTPAVNQCFEEGYMAFGPFSSDGLFGSRDYANFDGVLALYHDQGLGPFKALARDEGVNFTGGLKVIRTSPDHGTGYDIAGQNIADPGSMRRAIYEALDIARARRDWQEARRNPLPIDLPAKEERPDRGHQKEFKEEKLPQENQE